MAPPPGANRVKIVIIVFSFPFVQSVTIVKSEEFRIGCKILSDMVLIKIGTANRRSLLKVYSHMKCAFRFEKKCIRGYDI